MKTSDSVVRSTAVVSSCTALSRILGLVRMILMAGLFGTSLLQSAFVIAFRIPNLFRRLFGEGALSAAFIPVFSESIEKEGRDKAWQFAVRTMSFLGTVLAAIVIVVVAGVRLCLLYAPLSSKAAAVLALLEIMFPYMFFICLVALCMAILNSFRHFFVPAATPILLNVIWIGALVACPFISNDPSVQIVVVAWAILVAGVLQLLAQFPALFVHGYRPTLSFSWSDPRIARVLLLMGPAAVGMGVLQINVLVDSLLAFLVGEWAPAALAYADLIVYFPLGVFGTALGTVLLPTFSRQVAAEQPGEVTRTLNLGIRLMLYVMVPAAAGLVVLADPVVRVMFERGNFDALSTIQTTRALVFFAPGLVVFGLYKALVPVFYARKEIRPPVRVAVWMVVLNFGLNLLFIWTWPTGYKHAGLAFATVLSSTVSALILALLLRSRIGAVGWGNILVLAMKVLAATGVMVCAVYGVRMGLAAWAVLAKQGVLLRLILELAGSVIAGLVVYLGIGALLCRQESIILWSALRRKPQNGVSPQITT